MKGPKEPNGPRFYEAVEVGGVVIGVGYVTVTGALMAYRVVCNTLMDGDTNGKNSRKWAKRIADGLNLGESVDWDEVKK